LRITDLVRQGTNELVIANAAQASVTEPMCVAEARVLFRPASGASPTGAGPPAGPLEVFAPASKHKIEYALRELPGAKLEIRFNGGTFTIASEFSTPEPAWMHGSNGFFAHRRSVEKRDEAIVVLDTFTNLTRENLPLMQRHLARPGAGSLKQVWLAGLSPAGLEGSSGSPENPTTFGATATGGFGLLPLNDEFLVHTANFAADGSLGGRATRLL
jgi:hypothetical protein